MKKFPYLPFVVAIVCLLITCGCTGPENGKDEMEIVTGMGTVTYISLEGGFYGIVDDGGVEYLPLNLEEEFQKDGLKVEFEAIIKNDVATIQQWGIPVEITSIQAFTGFEDNISLWESGSIHNIGDVDSHLMPVLLRTASQINLQLRCIATEDRIVELQENGRVIELLFSEPKDITISQYVPEDERFHIVTNETGYRILPGIQAILFILNESNGKGFTGHILLRGENEPLYGCWAIMEDEGPDITWPETLSALVDDAIEGKSVADLLAKPAYNTQVTIYGEVSLLGELFCPCFRLASGGESVEVWYGLMVEDDGTEWPDLYVEGLSNSDTVRVTGELKPGGTHHAANVFWASKIEKIQ
jgi:hypothetical protein